MDSPASRRHLARGEGGFTLVELLVTIGIVALLTTLLIASVGEVKGRVRRQATESEVETIRNAIAQYYSEFHDYPPDGYDRDPAWGAATATCSQTGPSGITLPTAAGPLRYSGSGCLVYFLCYPLVSVTGPGPTERHVVGPFLSSLALDRFSAHEWDESFTLAVPPSNPAYKPAWAACELLDADHLPIHYDRVHDRTSADFATFFDPLRFSGANGLAAHSDQQYLSDAGEVLAHNDCCDSLGDHSHAGANRPLHADPRSRAAADGCLLDGPAVGPWCAGDGYDLWAHGLSFANGRTAAH